MTTAELPEFTWRKSSYSGDNANCVEVGLAAVRVGIRDTKDRDGGALVLPRSGFAAFLHIVR